MSPIAVTVIVVVIVAILVAVVVTNRRRSNDGVDSFRRQIDALSPEARRPVVDQVQNAAEGRKLRDDEPAEEPEDEDGSRGS